MISAGCQALLLQAAGHGFCRELEMVSAGNRAVSAAEPLGKHCLTHPHTNSPSKAQFSQNQSRIPSAVWKPRLITGLE